MAAAICTAGIPSVALARTYEGYNGMKRSSTAEETFQEIKVPAFASIKEVTAEEANQIGYQEAGLQPGDTVCIGMSGSFPGLGIASIAAANEMGVNVRVIASYGASM